MVSKDDVVGVINYRLNRVLSIVELIVPAEKFPMCRKLILDEFGRDGLGKDLDGLFWGRTREERDGAGGLISRKKDGAA
jgi:hypothetical protein